MTLENLLNDASIYLAHLPANKDNFPKETLIEHSNLVLDYTKQLTEVHQLNLTIDSLIKNSLSGKSTSYFLEYLKTLFFESIYLHDLGKVNPNFQYKKMNNNAFHPIKLEVGSDHSFPGFILYLNAKLNDIMSNPEFRNEEKLSAIFFSILFGQQVIRHHSSHLPDTYEFINEKLNFANEETKDNIFQVLNLVHQLRTNKRSTTWNTVSQVNQQSNITWVSDKLKKFKNKHISTDSFSLFALLKLHYSLLTASDYLATTHYMNHWGKELLADFGIINDELRQKIIRNAMTKKSYNKKAYEELDGFQFICPQKQSNDNLNQLRQELAVEVIQTIRKYDNDLIYYIEAPTGGGKTNLSMLALAEIMRQHPIKNVFYVFPFTTLITQTYQALKEALGLSEDELVELHSKAGFPEKDNSAKYGKEKQNHIDYLFANYPISLLSHVKFFDILKTNRKEQNYLLHRIANSVVIVDELQSYNPKDWDKLIYFIDNYARQFNIRFILMSATLPKLGNMEHVKTEVRYLISNKNKYFQNPNFSNRVEFDFSLLELETPTKENKNIYLNNLASKVLSESTSYASSNEKYQSSVFSIIEFIFKQTATDFYEIINEKHTGFFDEIFVLSGTILEFRRKEIIHYLKNEVNRNKKVLLITTQVVEAGVDIDMDLGFKDQSLIDSDEQLAGRINRNVNKPACKLFLFNCDTSNIIYGRDNRYKLMKKEFYSDYKDILSTKDFDRLYNEVMQRLDTNSNSTMVRGFDDFESHIKALRFQTINDEFKIIDQYSESIFVPLPIPVYISDTDKKERNFSEKDLEFLEQNGVLVSDSVYGEQIFKLYEYLITNPNADFATQKTEMKKLQGIMSQFTFSLMAHSSILSTAKANGHGKELYGFYYLSHWDIDNCYDPHFGLNIKEDGFNFI